METITTMLTQREIERRRRARRDRAHRIGAMIVMAIYITAASGVVLHLISKAIEQAAYDAVHFEVHKW